MPAAAAASAAVAAFASRLSACSTSCSSSTACSRLIWLGSLRVSLFVPRRLGSLVRMAHSGVTRATLGLTEPNAVEVSQISFSAKEIDFAEWKGDILAIGVTEKDISKDSNSKFENSILKRLDEQLNGLLAEASSEEDFTGKAGQSTILRLSGLGFKRLGLLGLGQCTTSSTTSAYRGLGEAVAAVAKASQASNAAVVLASSNGFSVESKLNTAYTIVLGTVLGVYEDNRFKSESKKAQLNSVDIIGLGFGLDLEQKLKHASDVCSGVIFGRELANAPANVLTPAVATT